MSMETHNILSEIPQSINNHEEWRSFQKKSINLLRKTQKGLHMRARVKWRQQMKNLKVKRENQRKNQQEVKQYYNYALKRKSHTAKPTVLYENMGSEIKIIDGKKKVREKELEYSKKFMGKGRQRWYLKNKKRIAPFLNTDYGKKWRKDLQNGQLSNKQWQQIPQELRGVFKCAQACKDKTGQTMKAEMYGNIFTSEITLKELDKYIARIKKNTAPGLSGIRVDHIAALPDNLRKAIAKLLSIPYTTGMGYSAWKEEIVNWTPKEDGNPDINKRRPLMYYEVLRKMCIGMRVRRVLNVWRKHGIIDENNYAFLTGKSTMQPLMIKKMILEEAEKWKKKLTLIDVDFSKAYDSTEKFAKEISLRRMGFPEEGLELWQMYDDSRNMRIMTAFEITEGFHPECGAWGQGAVESPTGWLGFMCWMSEYVEKMSKDSYIYGKNDFQLKITKVIYADDGTYFQKSRKGGQNIMNAVATFATATGIVVKPSKSYVYSTDKGSPIMIPTYDQSHDSKLGKVTKTKLKELGENDFFRHLGNIQNAKGENSIKNTIMYDGSQQMNILDKTALNMKALLSRNITIGGTLQVIKSVVLRQILYPTMFSNLNEIEIDKIQRKVQTTIRKKMRLPKYMNNYIMYMHEDMGGMGQNSIIDQVNTERLMILLSCMEEGGQMKKIINGAIYRLKMEARINNNPLATTITNYMTPNTKSWLYNLKVWMEKKDITIIQPGNDTLQKQDKSIMETCERLTGKNEVWNLINRKNITSIADTLHSNGVEKDEIWWNEPKLIVSEIKAQITPAQNKFKYAEWPIYKKFAVGTWVEYTTTGKARVGQILERAKDKIVVMEWRKRNKQYQPYKKKNWKKKNSTEARLVLNDKRNKILHILSITPKDSSSDEEEHMNDDTPTMPTIDNEGLWYLSGDAEPYAALLDRANSTEDTIHGVSDGSVRESQEEGTFAWALLHKIDGNTYEPMGVSAQGWEGLYSTKLPTQEVHSYRMEALGLLSVLTYLRTEIRWKGKVEWHIDSKSVIDTFAICERLHKSSWHRQRDKDIWTTLQVEKRHWKGRIKITHVESHVDKKRDAEGNKRIPTSIQLMNIYVDKLADEAYENRYISKVSPNSFIKNDQPRVFKGTEEITGNWRNQIMEELRIDESKKQAKINTDWWGLCPEEIEWGRMRKTSGNKTINQRLKAAKLMNGKRATKDRLLKFEFTSDKVCVMCGDRTETNKHILCYCTNSQIVEKRQEAKSKIMSLIGEHKDTTELQTVANILYGTDAKGRARNFTSENRLPEKWKQAWNKKKKDSRMEETEGRAAEIMIKLGNIAPLWTGVLTKAFTWLIKDIVSQKRKKFIKNYRQILQEFAKESWNIRCEKMYDPELEKERYERQCILQKQKKEAKRILKNLKFAGGITTRQIMDMSPIQQVDFVNRSKNKWKQSTLREQNFQSTITPKKVNSRTQSDVQQESKKIRKHTQLIIQTNGILTTKVDKDTTADMLNPPKKYRKRRNNNKDTSQVSLPEKWDFTSPQCKSTVRVKSRNTSPFKRWRGRRHDACRVCDKGGTLVECHTCKVACHVKCGINMPSNVLNSKVIWRCQECIQESGPTKCSFAIYTKKQTRPVIRPRNTQSKQRHETQIHLRNLDSHDTNEGEITGQIKNISVAMEHTIEHVIKKQVISVLPDGFCLFRALGKNHNIHPGEVIKYMKNKCIKMIKKHSKMKLENNVLWYTKWANTSQEWTELQSNISSHCDRSQWGGINEIQIWAMIIKHKVIVLDSEYDTATVYHPDGNTLPQRIRLDKLNILHNTETRQHKQLQYLLYNGRDHYNSISTGAPIHTKIKTEGNINDLRRKIGQQRNKRIKNSKLNKEEITKRQNRQNKCVVATDTIIKTNEHQARSARLIAEPPLNTALETDHQMTREKINQIDNQIIDITKEQEKRTKRTNKQKEENKHNKRSKRTAEENILKSDLNTHIRKHKRKQDVPSDKKFEGEKRYKYKEKHDDDAI